MAGLKVGIVAGEKSGDYLGAELIRSIRATHPDAEFVGLCGPLMQAQGATSLAEMDKISIFGLEGLFGSIREILAIRKSIFDYLVNWKADVFIGVDVPDFNLTLEKKLKRQGIPTVHYVSPTVWAWRSGRIKKIKQAVDLMLTLFPFEETFYQKQGVRVAFVGHPLADEVLAWPDQSAFRRELMADSSGRLIAVLPGSRMSEVTRLSPVMFAAIKQLLAEQTELRFVLPAANKKIYHWLSTSLNDAGLTSSVLLLDGQSRDVLSVADVAILASGTAALEAGMFGVPMVVLYKVAWLSAAIFGHTIEVTHFSMPNHLTESPVVPELIQHRATAENLVAELHRLLTDENHYTEMRDALRTIAPMLAEDTGQLAAAAILEMLDSRKPQ